MRNDEQDDDGLVEIKTLYELTRQEGTRNTLVLTGALETLCLRFKSACGKVIIISETDGTKIISLTSDCLLIATRALRNACAGVVENAAFIGEKDTIIIILRLCREIALISPSSYSPNTPKLVLALCQLLANFAACSNAAAAQLWKLEVDRQGIRDLLAAATASKDRLALSAAIATIYNCICADNEASMDRLSFLCQSRPLFCQILLSVLNSRLGIDGGVTASSPTSPTSAEETPDDPVLQWVHLLCAKMFERGRLLQVFELVGARRQGSSMWAENESEGGGIHDSDSANAEGGGGGGGVQPSWAVRHEQVSE